MSLLIRNVVIFTNDDQNKLLYNQALAIDENRICEIGAENNMLQKYGRFKKIDGQGRLLMPGFINTHMHFYGTFARGITLKKTPKNFPEILSELWWKLDKALDLEAVYYSALIPAISSVKHGVTSIIDHHASPNSIAGSLDKIEDALSLLGLRAVLCYEVSDRSGQDGSQQGLAENARYIDKCQAANLTSKSHLLDGMLGLHASFTLNDNTLNKAAELNADMDCGCHIHVLEDYVDQEISLKKFGKKVVPRLAEYGILGKKSIAAHGIYLEDEDIDLLQSSETSLVHNPQSNMNNAVGRADIFSFNKKGITTGIGTDGMSASIMPDVRTANLLHKHDLKNSNIGWSEVQQMLLKNNPKIFNKITSKKVGMIKEGFLADIILLDYYPPTPLDSDNLWGHLLYGITDASVNTTIINGKLVMHDKQIAGVDEQEIAARSSESAKVVWKNFSEM